MNHTKIQREIAKEHPVGTQYVLIRKSICGFGGIILDYKVGGGEWYKKRQDELQHEYPKYIVIIERRILGVTDKRQRQITYGKQRRKAGGHGYTGGDGYVEL